MYWSSVSLYLLGYLCVYMFNLQKFWTWPWTKGRFQMTLAILRMTFWSFRRKWRKSLDRKKEALVSTIVRSARSTVLTNLRCCSTCRERKMTTLGRQHALKKLACCSVFSLSHSGPGKIRFRSNNFFWNIFFYIFFAV